MSDTENPAVTPVVVDISPAKPARDIFWTSEAERDAFLAEHARRKEAGESLADLDIPAHVADVGDEE
jgi:hypothetical protein